MLATLTSWGRMRPTLTLACMLGVLAGGGMALARSNSVHITLAPSTGKSQSIYKIHVKGYAAASDLQLVLATVIEKSKPCPKSDSGSGFGKLNGIATPNGQLIGPMRIRKGKLDKTIKTRISGDPGTYSVCAYFQRGAVTKARASAPFTITG